MAQQTESRGVPTRELLRHHGRRPHLAGRELVPRERVLAPRLERLEESMVLVAAPAGYGKTTFLAQWEDADERPFAWITLDERYNDPVLLLGSIAAAIDEITPLDDAVFAPLLSPRPNLWDVVVPRLCHALRQCEQPFVIVLDDVHNLTEPGGLAAAPRARLLPERGLHPGDHLPRRAGDAARPSADPAPARRGPRPRADDDRPGGGRPARGGRARARPLGGRAPGRADRGVARGALPRGPRAERRG